jgi:hypothetical protein
VPRVPLPDVGITIRETCTASCEAITPRSWLLRTHSPIPLALLSFGLGLVRGVSAGCDQPLLLAGPSRRYLCESFPECLGPCHGGPVECTCLFLPPRHRPSPVHYRGRLPALTRQNDFMTDPLFETAAISLCSGPQVCSIGIERGRAAVGRGFPSLPFRSARWVHNSTIATFPAAPL